MGQSYKKYPVFDDKHNVFTSKAMNKISMIKPMILTTKLNLFSKIKKTYEMAILILRPTIRLTFYHTYENYQENYQIEKNILTFCFFEYKTLNK